MKKTLLLATFAIACAIPTTLAAQARMIPGGGAGGYAGGAEPLLVLPYANGGVMGGMGQQQAAQAQPGANTLEQEEDLAEQQAPSVMLNDPDDSVLARPPADDPQDGSGFDGLGAVDNVDSSY